MADTVLTSGLAFVLRIVVAKILAPEDFGIAAIALTVITILQGINSGFWDDRRTDPAR